MAATRPARSTDATVARAEGVGGTVERFVELMNQQAKALGMKNTSYRNPEGLTEAGHTTTARDLSILSVRLLQDFPDYVSYYTIKDFEEPLSPDIRSTIGGMSGRLATRMGAAIRHATAHFQGIESRRRLLLIGAAAFAVASLLCAFSTTPKC